MVMINLLSSEIYKLKEGMLFRLMAVLTVLLTLSQYGFYMVFEVIMKGEPAEEQAAMMERVRNMDMLDILHSMFGSCNAIILVTIFVCCFVINDYSSGMVTNYVGKGYRREEVFLAKFLAVQFGAVMLYLLTALTVFAGGIVFMGTDGLNAVFFHDFGNYLALHILYLTGYTAFIILVCTMARNMAAGILISILGIMLFSNIIAQGIDLVLSSLKVEIGISQYWIVTVIESCPVRDIPSGFVTTSGIVTGMWLVVSMIAAMLWFEKRDVR